MKILLIGDDESTFLTQLQEVLGSDLRSVTATTSERALRLNLEDFALAIIIANNFGLKKRVQLILSHLKRHPWVSPIIAATKEFRDSPELKSIATVPTVSIASSDELVILRELVRNAEDKFVTTKISISPQIRTDVSLSHRRTATSVSSRVRDLGVSYFVSPKGVRRPTYDIWLARNTGFWLGAATSLLALGALAWIYRDEAWSTLSKLLLLTKSSIPPSLATFATNKANNATNPNSASKDIDTVDCSAFANQIIVPGATSLLRVSLHQRNQLEGLRRNFGQSEFTTPSQLMAMQVHRGDRITVQFDGDEEVIADEPVQYVDWSGETETLQFKITFPQQLAVNELHPIVRVWINEHYIGRLVLSFYCGTAQLASHSASVCQAVQGAEPVFVSYARRDWLRAKYLAEDLEIVRLKPFIDVLRLRFGEDWESRLLNEIDGCNTFCVIWSHAAKKSSWVKKEYKRAIDRKVGENFRPPEIFVIPKPSRRRILGRKSIPQPWDFAARFHHTTLEHNLVHMQRD